jgi:hypothetical protein
VRVAAMKFGAFSACALVLLFASPAFSASSPVLFEGTVDATCTLTVTRNGTLGVSTNLQTLSSHVGVGQSGEVSLTTTGGVTLSVDPVTVFTPPSGDVTPITWTPSYATTGATNFTERTVSTPIPGPGDSTVSVHLAGTKSGSNRFAAGLYSATVTVRCE